MWMYNLREGGLAMKKIKKNIAASWCCEASTVVDIKKMVKDIDHSKTSKAKKEKK